MADKFITVKAIMLLIYCNHIWNTTNNNNNNSIQLNRTHQCEHQLSFMRCKEFKCYLKFMLCFIQESQPCLFTKNTSPFHCMLK